MAALPAWSASMVQLPAVTKVSMPPEVTVHTPVVDEENSTANPDVAETPLPRIDKSGAVPKACVPGSAKVMVWLALGVALLLALEAALVPLALVAVTVKV
ncbi:hypothetical protein D3C71_1077210 [compost metagenome]